MSGQGPRTFTERRPRDQYIQPAPSEGFFVVNADFDQFPVVAFDHILNGPPAPITPQGTWRGCYILLQPGGRAYMHTIHRHCDDLAEARRIVKELGVHLERNPTKPEFPSDYMDEIKPRWAQKLIDEHNGVDPDEDDESFMEDIL